MDRYGRDLRNLQEKGSQGSKIQIAEQKNEASKVNYYNLHDELMKDLPLLYKDRIPFFDPATASVTSSVSLTRSTCWPTRNIIAKEPNPQETVFIWLHKWIDRISWTINALSLPQILQQPLTK